MFRKRLIPLMLAALCSQALLGQTISINDAKIEATEIDKVVYVPLRSVAQQLNETVAYNDGISVIFKNGVVYAIDSKDSSVVISDLKTNTKNINEVAVQVVDGVTYIPLEIFSDIFGVNSSYNEETGDIEISEGATNNNYADDLKSSIKELEDLISKTMDKEKLSGLTANRDLLIRAYMEHKGYAAFSGEYTGEEKKQLIDNILKEIKEVTGSSLNTSRSGPRSTRPDDATGIGVIPQLLGVYAFKGYDKYTGNAAYIAAAKFKTNGKYFGGSIDYALYADGLEISRSYVSRAWDKEEYANNILGTGYITINQYALDTKGYTLDTNSINEIIYKTNIFGDYVLSFDSNGDYVFGDPSYYSEVKDIFLNIVSDTQPQQTTDSVYQITF